VVLPEVQHQFMVGGMLQGEQPRLSGVHVAKKNHLLHIAKRNHLLDIVKKNHLLHEGLV